MVAHSDGQIRKFVSFQCYAHGIAGSNHKTQIECALVACPGVHAQVNSYVKTHALFSGECVLQCRKTLVVLVLEYLLSAGTSDMLLFIM